MRIKCCGITSPEDARYAEACGADAIGVVVFSPTSLRAVTLERVREIFDAVGPFTTRVAVTQTTSHDDLEQILALHPDAIQLSHPFVFRKKPGASGRDFDRSHARDVVQRSKVPVILAGGLTPENVADAIRQVQPYAVDVASGIEKVPGIKDPRKIAEFIAAARGT
jgi:phosphoribosylanthranilate isomerase